MSQQSITIAKPHNATENQSRSSQRPLRVMHVLSVSIPHINGYALRSKYIVETQAASGHVEPCVVTSPFYPGLKGTAEDTVIDGIPYYRVASPQDKGALRNPRLLPFVALHWAKSLVNWSIPMLRRRRQDGMRFLKRASRFSRQVVKRGQRVVARGKRFARRIVNRIVSGVVRRVKPVVEPLFGGPFLRAVAFLGRAVMAAAWILLRPFVVTAQFLSRKAVQGLRSLRAFFGGAGRSAQPDGIPLRTRLIQSLQEQERRLLLSLFERELVKLCRRVQPDVIHVHSPYFCGVPAVKAAKRAAIPVVYEVRGIWEESGVAQGSFERDSDVYRMWHREETWAMKNADAVTCICDELRKEIIGRGVERHRVFVAANAVDSTLFSPAAGSADAAREVPDSVREVRQKLGKVTMGYIGSIRALEGVDGLVRGAAEVIHRGVDATLLIVGGGKGIEELQALADELGIGDRAVFTGQVPHDEVQFYYELIDIFVVSRPASRVAQLVTPLKPLEAMAMGKALIVSDLPALRELVNDGETGMVYRAEDAGDLADQCIRLITDTPLRQRLAATARNWVVHERSWGHTIVPQLQAYELVVPGFAAPHPAQPQTSAKAA